MTMVVSTLRLCLSLLLVISIRIQRTIGIINQINHVDQVANVAQVDHIDQINQVAHGNRHAPSYPQPELTLMAAKNFTWAGLDWKDCLQVKTSYGNRSIRCCKVLFDKNGEVIRPAKKRGNRLKNINNNIDSFDANAVGNSVEFRCLPHFVIAGTQKSGTTALSALLADIPLVSFHPKKEAHYFDKIDFYKKGLVSYLASYREWNYSDPNQYYPPMFGEASPYYIASRQACQRMANDLPQAKIIVLLREPVARAYSEYQMKKRRVESQNNFIEMLSAQPSVLYQCLQNFEKALLVNKSADYSKLRECLPKNITNHNHYAKFVKAIRQIKLDGPQVNSLNVCFKRIPAVAASGGAAPRVPQSVRNIALNPLRKGQRNQRSLEAMGGEANELSQQEDQVVDTDVHQEAGEEYKRIPSLSEQVSEPEPSTLSLRRQRRRLQRDSTPIFNQSFQPGPCMGKYGKEKLPDIVSLKQEAHLIAECFKKYSPKQDLNHLDAVLDKCVDVKGGISGQYVYRSLYAIQLYHCFKSIPPSNVYVVASERMQRQPDLVIPEIMKFLGMPEAYAQNLDLQTRAGNQTEIYRSVVHYFPRFEAATGWSVDGEYEPLPTEIKEYLVDFFRAHNDLLFELLGINPFPEWD